MSNAKEKYYKLTSWLRWKKHKIPTNYIIELEKENKEMLETLILEYKISEMSPYEHEKILRLKTVIEKITGISIEKILNEQGKK